MAVVGDDVLAPDPHRYPIDVVDMLAYMPPGISITDTSDPSSAEVALMILNVVDEINGRLRSRGFVFPLQIEAVDPIGISYLNTCNIFGAMALWAKTKYPADAGPGGEKGLVKFWNDKYQAFLEGVTTGAIGLPEEARSVVASGFDGEKDFHDDMEF